MLFWWLVQPKHEQLVGILTEFRGVVKGLELGEKCVGDVVETAKTLTKRVEGLSARWAILTFFRRHDDGEDITAVLKGVRDKHLIDAEVVAFVGEELIKDMESKIEEGEKKARAAKKPGPKAKKAQNIPKDEDPEPTGDEATDKEGDQDAEPPTKKSRGRGRNGGRGPGRGARLPASAGGGEAGGRAPSATKKKRTRGW